MTLENQASFERCPHDRQNPYLMVNVEMIRDKSISPKAKGVLMYLLSLPRDWKIFHAQLEDGLNVGEEYIRSAMNELIEAGYAERTRVRVKGIYQPYKYIIREFKKCLPNGENQPGLTSLENPALLNKEELNKEKGINQQQARERAPVVDVVVEKISSSCDEITYIATGGVKKTIDESQIYQHFLKLPYKTETIKEAIEKVREKKEPIGNIFHFLEGICKTLEYNASLDVKSSRKDLGEFGVPKCNSSAAKLEPDWWKNK